MLDSKLLRNSLDLVEDAFKKRGFEVDLTVLQKLEETRKALQFDTEKMSIKDRDNHIINKLSKMEKNGAF